MGPAFLLTALAVVASSFSGVLVTLSAGLTCGSRGAGLAAVSEL